jgi:hypothetical protein
VTVNVMVLLYAVGAALLALWTLGRFATFGPRTMFGAAATFGLTLLAESALPAAAALAERAAGRPGALLLVILPFLTLLFWASGRVLYALVTSIAPRLK